MATKVYYSCCKHLNVLLPDGCCVSFREVMFEEGCRFSTNDPVLQEALEGCSGFNHVFVLQDAVEEAAQQEAAQGCVDGGDVVGVVYEDVHRVQEAIDVIKDVCRERGLVYHTIRSRAEVHDAARRLGLCFKNLT